jgi:hypothetical protein
MVSVERSRSGVHACIMLVQGRMCFLERSKYFADGFISGTVASIWRVHRSTDAMDDWMDSVRSPSDDNDAQAFACIKRSGAG